MFHHGVGTRQANRLMLSIPSQFLSLIFTIPIYLVEHNLAPLLGYPKCIFTLPFFLLVLKDIVFLLTLGRWILTIWNFVIFDRLLPYHLWNPYGQVPTFLSLILIRACHLFGTYSHFSFDILLGGPVYY